MTATRARAAVAGLGLAAFGLLAACGGGNPVPQASTDQGRALIVHFGCGACHTIGGIATADGKVGPELTDFRSRRSIVGKLANRPPDVERWIQHPQQIKPGSDMPELGVTPPQAKAIAAYLYSQ